jgi:hypothetical protein
MLGKKDIFGDWNKRCMCGDYSLVNKQTHPDKYVVPLPEEIFDAFAQAKVFNTLDLRLNYHQLPLKEGDKIETTFSELILMGTIISTNGSFCHSV